MLQNKRSVWIHELASCPALRGVQAPALFLSPQCQAAQRGDDAGGEWISQH